MLQDGAYKVMIIKHEGNFYALGAISPYDGCTDLSKGQVFGNKLLSPKNGNAYNITNGEVEYGPGLDNIPIFHIMIQEGKVVLQIPKKPPVKIRPYVSVRDYADMRKVVIIGGTEAAVTAAETLRSLEYTVNFFLKKFQREKSPSLLLNTMFRSTHLSCLNLSNTWTTQS